jgi:hypothetical protein
MNIPVVAVFTACAVLAGPLALAAESPSAPPPAKRVKKDPCPPEAAKRPAGTPAASGAKPAVPPARP